MVLHKTKGFTLIEMLVVIVIIGILAATIVPRIMSAPTKARDVGRIASLDGLMLPLAMTPSTSNWDFNRAVSS